MKLPVLLWLAAVAAGAAAADPREAATVTGTARGSAQPAPKRAADPGALLGRWELKGEPRRIVELRAGGSGTIDGAPLTWSVDGDRLTITDPGGTDTVGWRVEGDRLVLAGPFDTEIVLVRR